MAVIIILGILGILYAVITAACISDKLQKRRKRDGFAVRVSIAFLGAWTISSAGFFFEKRRELLALNAREVSDRALAGCIISGFLFSVVFTGISLILFTLMRNHQKRNNELMEESEEEEEEDTASSNSLHF